jgi:hypothetical protein
MVKIFLPFVGDLRQSAANVEEKQAAIGTVRNSIDPAANAAHIDQHMNPFGIRC